MFGIEIRRRGNIHNIYNDVDAILQKNNIRPNSITTSLVKDSVAHCLFKMMKPDKYLDICEIKECAELSGICISGERLLLYRTQHCNYWKDMLPEFREQLIAMIMDDFRDVLTHDSAKDVTNA